MIDYFDVKGSKVSQFLYALFMNLITICVFEAVLSAIIYAIKNKIGNNSTVYSVLGYVLFFQLIVLSVVAVCMSFRHKCIYVCDDYIEIKDGLILYRLLYKRKIHYSDIIECRKYIPKSHKYHSNVRYTDLLFRSFSEMHPYYSAEYNRSVVIYRRTFGSYVFSPENQEGFINAVNKRLHKSADQNPS